MFCIQNNVAEYWSESPLLQIHELTAGSRTSELWGGAFMEHLALLLHNRHSTRNVQLQDLLLQRLQQATRLVTSQRMLTCMKQILDIASVSDFNEEWSPETWHELYTECRIIRGDTCTSYQMDQVAHVLNRVADTLTPVAKAKAGAGTSTRSCASELRHSAQPWHGNTNNLYDPEEES